LIGLKFRNARSLAKKDPPQQCLCKRTKKQQGNIESANVLELSHSI